MAGEHALDDYFARHAVPNDAAKLGRAYVLRRGADDDSALPALFGYYTLCMALALLQRRARGCAPLDRRRAVVGRELDDRSFCCAFRIGPPDIRLAEGDFVVASPPRHALGVERQDLATFASSAPPRTVRLLTRCRSRASNAESPSRCA